MRMFGKLIIIFYNLNTVDKIKIIRAFVVIKTCWCMPHVLAYGPNVNYDWCSKPQ